jgi:hypothetical protein
LPEESPVRQLAFCLVIAAAMPASAHAQDVPTEVGQCVETSIKEIISRLEGMPDSGDAVVYANDLYGVSYEQVDALRNSQVGDPVKLCLTALPTDCPPGDERGKVYSALNERTKESWELPDAEHMCGGA